MDIQGKGNIFSDPEMVTVDGMQTEHFGRGNVGIRSIKTFFEQHQCNPVCFMWKLEGCRPDEKFLAYYMEQDKVESDDFRETISNNKDGDMGGTVYSAGEERECDKEVGERGGSAVHVREEGKEGTVDVEQEKDHISKRTRGENSCCHDRSYTDE